MVSTTVEAQQIPLIELISPLPGFPLLRRFALVELDETGLMCELRSVEEEQVRFLVVPPGPFFPDYAVDIDDEVAEALGAVTPDDVLVLVVVTVGSSWADSTANLAAPLVVHVGHRRAQQVILDDPGLSLAAPLLGP